ncbi:MAG: hypothetical protein AAF748_12455 [Pseudomonadota bacterium]
MQETNYVNDPRESWCALRDRVLATHADVVRGKMMAADALTYGGKVFAFYATKGGRIGLGCRVGRATDLSRFHLTDWQHLAPFKSKPPMKDWIVVGVGDLSRWDAVAAYCLNTFRTGENTP